MAARAEALRERAPAKINLFLHVGEKRADGFHALESLVVFAAIGDALDFETSETLALSLGGPFAAGLEGGGDNLVLKAARALVAHAKHRAGARMRLEKSLPVASGIGGGSADAAATLRGLSKLWKLELAESELLGLAAALGSDVPVCVASRSAWMEGRGERVTAVAVPGPVSAVLVNPGVAVPTGKVFGALETRSGTGHAKPAAWSDRRELFGYLKTTRNDLEAPARAMTPVIGDVLDALASREGVELVRMSGSGATCFGLFATDERAEAAARSLRSARPGWWIAATHLAAEL